MINDFYQIANSNGIVVDRFRLPKTKSISLEEDDGSMFIAIDDSKPMTHAEEQAHLGHELGHCLYGGMYTRRTPFDIKEQHEVRADRWYIARAIPKDTLLQLLRSNYDVWEIADKLDTTENYVRQAYYYYMGT